MKIFFQHIWSPKVVLIPFLAAFTTFLCVEFRFTLDMTIVASVFFIGIFFCFSVVMNSANDRRFKAYDQIAIIKATLLSFHELLPLRSSQKNKKIAQKELKKVFPAIADFLQEKTEAVAQKKLQAADRSITHLEKVIQILRHQKCPAAVLSRAYDFMQEIRVAFEKLMVIKEFRTPRALRYFLEFSLGISVFVLAPQFANMDWWGICAAALIAFILIVLMRIQEMIESPFEEDIDDIRFEFSEDFAERIEAL